MEQNPLDELKVKCPGCGTENNAKAGLKKEWVEICGNKILITYYRCKGCRKIHVVQLDSEYTQELLKEIQESMIYAFMCQKSGRTPKKKKAMRALKLNKKINSIRKSLNVEYDSVLVKIENEEIKIKVEMQEV